MNADKRDLHDFGVIKSGAWTADGLPVGWIVNQSYIADDLPRWLLNEPVLHLAAGPSCCVYLRGCYSDRLTKARKHELIKSGGAAALLNAEGSTAIRAEPNRRSNSHDEIERLTAKLQQERDSLSLAYRTSEDNVFNLTQKVIPNLRAERDALQAKLDALISGKNTT
jgi:hypothetical protein